MRGVVCWMARGVTKKKSNESVSVNLNDGLVRGNLIRNPDLYILYYVTQMNERVDFTTEDVVRGYSKIGGKLTTKDANKTLRKIVDQGGYDLRLTPTGFVKIG